MDHEVMYKLIERLLPMGQEDWIDLALAFNRRMVGTNRPSRDWGSIQQKHRRLKNTSKPTGDPDYPPEIKRAKEAQRAIEERSSIMEQDVNENSLQQCRVQDDNDNDNDNNDGIEGGEGVAEDADEDSD